MLKGRGRDLRSIPAASPAHTTARPVPAMTSRPAQPRVPLAKPEPDYEVVEFPSDQYVNAKLQPPPPPPPRPPTGHPVQAGASCGLCGGGGARVRCAECGRRALCASCDDMYHRHPKRRHHQRQALTPSQIAVDERPPLPPKGTPPVPPPRRHKTSASPKPPMQDQRRATLGHPAVNMGSGIIRTSPVPPVNLGQHPVLMHPKMATGSHLGSMPFLPTTIPTAVPQLQHNVNTMGHLNAGWNRPRGSLQGFNMQHMAGGPESWENPEAHSWGRPLRRGASVLELGGANSNGSVACGGPECGGCAAAAAAAWRYGSCAALDQPWHPGWQAAHPGFFAPAPLAPHLSHHHAPQTPQPYRRADSRAVSRAASRTGSRAASPALSMRSRASRRTKHRTPSPPMLPSSDADSESESENETGNRRRSSATSKNVGRTLSPTGRRPSPTRRVVSPVERALSPAERATSPGGIGPAPPAPDSAWHCEHCTFLNEAGVRVCAVCCRTPTAPPQPAPAQLTAQIETLQIAARHSSPAPTARNKIRENNEIVESDRVSTGCGSSPPKEKKNYVSKTQRLETPNRQENDHGQPRSHIVNRHDMAVGPSPPRDIKSVSRETTIPHETVAPPAAEPPTRHSVSVGPSPPRESSTKNNLTQKSNHLNVQKKSAGTSPPPDVRVKSPSPTITIKAKVSNTGTSPPPQSISTQTYEDPSTWDRAPSVSRSRARRRFRDESHRERSRSRHSLSSDTRESERSVRTTGAWEWRETERESSPPPPRRRASHLDLRRLRRRDSLYGSQATSPERWSGSGRAASMEALAGGAREAERGLELAQLLADAERLGYNADEVRAALAQSPGAPLAWLRERWAGLAGAVRGAAARLAQRAPSEREARAALARHRGAVWPAVTECVEALRRQAAPAAVSAERRVRGRVWGAGAGAEVEAAPSARAEYGSDESDALDGVPSADEEWYPEVSDEADRWSPPPTGRPPPAAVDDVARTLGALLLRAGVPNVDENILLRSLLSEGALADLIRHPQQPLSSVDFTHSENDFIDAYNALTRASPLPSKEVNYRNEYEADVDITVNGENENVSVNDREPNPKHGNKLNTVLSKKVDKNHNNIPLQSNINHETQKIDDSPSQKPQNSITNINKHTIETNGQEIKSINHVAEIDEVSVSEKDEAYNNNSIKQQIDDKSNNLNDIVDNTQKLIQQMRDEINSDINSLDGRQTETSQSEHESSSNEEKESSYSETEEDSDHSSITSEESKDYSEESDQSTLESLKNKIEANNRTSSEENEQFEEALEHIDNLTEDVKNINIDILNSIAHSLQQDLTITLEKDINYIDDDNDTEEIKDDIIDTNLFIAVNTFEEIYDELNTQKTNIRNTPIEQTNISIQKPINLLTKYTATEITFKAVTPSKLIVIENIDPIYNAKLDTIEPENQNEAENAPVPVEEVEKENEVVISDQNIDNSEAKILNDENDVQHRNTETVKPDKNKINENKTSDQSSKESTPTKNETDSTIVETNTTKSAVTIKSNIPKPVKSMPKTKIAPKVIVSKVPVRKTSTKQYPAPAPPKAHFGNVKSGNVKQLQNKIFNSSTKTVTPEKDAPAIKDIAKPSTSTNIEPPPPVDSNVKQESPPKPARTKNNYFRETCRTEDEWTDSDSDQSQIIIRPRSEEEQNQPQRYSPPPPITLRRISGNIIDLATIRLPEGSPERQARMLLAEGATETWEQAQLAVELISRGTEPPVALLAALECADLSAALAYLHQDCELCASRFPEHEMVSMLRCTHRCCRECARLYFNVQITERSIADCVCPFCKMPELENLPEDAWLEYFAHLDILLKTLLETEVHELFQRKLRDRTLARDPNFRWCMECSSGFFVHPKQKKLRCPECRSVSCASCRKKWTSNHEGLTCEQYAVWLEDNDPERSVAAVQQHLRENGLECPRCHFKYSLSRGGCMHFTCTQCKYEFCYGCGKPFTMGARCGLSDYCAKLGLHAHHPRNCLFYLRDKEPHELQTLLQMNNVAYETETPEGSTGRCPVQLQRETPTGLVDGVCGHEAPPKHAGLCKNHYVEHLSRRVRSRGLDPLPILGVEDLETLVRRAALRPPPRPYGSLEGVYRRALTEVRVRCRPHYIEYLAGLARHLDPIPIMDVPELVAELRRRALPLPDRGPWDTDPIYAGMCAEIVREKIPLD